MMNATRNTNPLYGEYLALKAKVEELTKEIAALKAQLNAAKAKAKPSYR